MPASNPGIHRRNTRTLGKAEYQGNFADNLERSKAQKKKAKTDIATWEYNKTIDPNRDASKLPMGDEWQDKEKVKEWKQSGKYALPERQPNQSAADAFIERTQARVRQRMEKARGDWEDPMEYRLAPTARNTSELEQNIVPHMRRRLYGSGDQEYVHDYDLSTGEQMDSGSWQFVGNKNDTESEKHRDLAVPLTPKYHEGERNRMMDQAQRGALVTEPYGWVNQGGEPVRSNVEARAASLRSLNRQRQTALAGQGQGQGPAPTPTPPPTPNPSPGPPPPGGGGGGGPTPPGGGGGGGGTPPGGGGGGGGGGPTPPPSPVSPPAVAPSPGGGGPTPLPGGGGGAPPQTKPTTPKPTPAPPGVAPAPPVAPAAPAAQTTPAAAKKKKKPAASPKLLPNGDVSPVQPRRRKAGDPPTSEATPVKISVDRRTRGYRKVMQAAASVQQINGGRGLLFKDPETDAFTTFFGNQSGVIGATAVSDEDKHAHAYRSR